MMTTILEIAKQERFIRKIKDAHAIEMGAIVAYELHWKSAKGDHREEIQRIQAEELQHMEKLEEILAHFNTKRSDIKDTFVSFIGLIMGVLCFITGKFLPNLAASMMKKMGGSVYAKLAKDADDLGYKELKRIFNDMEKVEEEHEQYFKNFRSKG